MGRSKVSGRENRLAKASVGLFVAAITLVAAPKFDGGWDRNIWDGQHDWPLHFSAERLGLGGWDYLDVGFFIGGLYDSEGSSGPISGWWGYTGWFNSFEDRIPVILVLGATAFMLLLLRRR